MMYVRCPRCTGLIQSLGTRRISLNAERLKNSPAPAYRKSDLKIKPIKDNTYEDAYKIAEKALKLLQRDDVDSVMKMIRQNHDLDLTVTWNYLIRHKLDNRRLNAAFSDFQNMKKRQHFPNAHTYTILLKGLSRYHELGGRDKLEKVVDSLLNDKRIQPSIIHLNAALNVCLKSKDLKLAYELVERFNEAGMDEQDVVTYDTLFRLLKAVIEKEAVPGERYRDRTITQDARQCLDDTKNIWKDIETLWSSGHLPVDSRLLTSYTAVLVRGTKEDWKAGISAIETLCDLPSFTPVEADTKVTAKGARVNLDGELFTRLLELAEMMHDSALAEHYWQNAKAATSGTLSQGAYEARLRSLSMAKSPEKATALLDEMRAAGVPIGPSTFFLGLQCFFTHRPSTDLERALAYLRQYGAVETDNPDWQTIPIVTTLTKFVKASRAAGPSTEAFRLLRTVDWHGLASEAGQVPHHRQRLREAVRQLIRSCRSVRRLLDEAASGTSLQQTGASPPRDDARGVVQKLVKELLTVQAAYYSADAPHQP